jgi:ligand-binding sensor domain-containing protein/signal transduction histidine kinase/DNA-binding response OmpR family regulator
VIIKRKFIITVLTDGLNVIMVPYMKRKIKLVLICTHLVASFLVLSTDDCRAQQGSFQHLTVENGLSQNAVIALSQDARGFMWIGTPAGLNRYDGYRIKQYQSRLNDSTTLSGNNVLAILNDSRKTMWIGTFTGLNRYDPQSDRFTRIGLPLQKTVPVYALYEDRKGRVWTGTEYGLFVTNPAQPDKPQAVSLPRQEGPEPSWNVRAILEDRNGALWIGTTTGLICLPNPAHPTLIDYYKHDPQDPQSISSDFVTTIEEDRYGKLWIGTHSNGLNLYDKTQRSFQRFQHYHGVPTSIISNTIRKVLVDKQGLLWVGTQEGISILDEAGKLLHSYQQSDADQNSLSHNSIHSLFQDATGNIWIGTYFGGANYTYAINTQFSVIRKKDEPGFLNNNVISSITEDEKKNLWIGTEGGGLNYYDRSTGLFTSYRHAPNNPNSIGSNLVKVVYRDWQGKIWCGTHGGGLNLFDPVTKQFTRFLYEENNPTYLNSEVVSINEDSKGRLWVGSTLGIKLYNKTPHGLEPVLSPLVKNSLFEGTARYFLEDDKGRIWITTNNGLFVLKKDTITKVSDQTVNCIVQDRNAQVWTGLQQGGIAKYDEKTQKLEYLNQLEKMSNRNIFGILEDNQQHLWLSSDNGLLKFSPQQNQLQLFTSSDGLAGNAFNYNSFFKDSKGEFFFGGFNGITHFSPDEIATNIKAGHTVITDLKLFNKQIVPGDSTGLIGESMPGIGHLTLKHNQNVISLEFALLNYIKSNKNSYAYKLEGYDKDWVYTSIPVASYVNLPSADYDFYVKGANNDGVWSEPVQLKVEILPAFWNTWWAYCLYALVAAGIIFLISRYFFLRVLFKKEDELHQVKLNFFTNVSHEIRTHLTLIMAPVEKMQESEEVSSFARQQLESVKKNVNRLLKLVSELMDFRKAETGNLKLQPGKHDLIAFLEDIYNSFQDLSIKKNITTAFIFDGQSLPLYFDKEQLEKVFFNLLSNAIRFTPANGKIILQVTETPTEVVVKIIDNGRGIAAEYLDKVFTNFFQVDDHGLQNTGYGVGLALAKNIVVLHNGTITAESVAATGTEEGRTSFIVKLLKGKKHFSRWKIEELELLPASFAAVNADKSFAGEASVNDGKQATTLLVVEDNVELRNIIKEKFAEQFVVLEAADGVRGLEIAVSEMPDIIISDVMMPQMDGFELCRRLKTDHRTSHIPVVLLTAKSTQTDLVSGLETGANIYMTKPFSTKVLELNVNNLLVARENWRRLFAQQINSYQLPPEEDNKEPAISTIEQAFLDTVIKIIEENLDNQQFGVDMLSRKVAMSAPILYKKIRAVSNMSVNDFIKSIRLKKAAELLQEKHLNVFEVAQAVGYSDRKYFSQEFKKHFGKTPKEYATEE